jgi:hypothetical protein
MKKNQRQPVFGAQLPRHLRPTRVDDVIFAWHATTPERARFVVERDNRGKVSDRSDADAMLRWEEDRVCVYPAHRDPIERIETAMALFEFTGPFR